MANVLGAWHYGETNFNNTDSPFFVKNNFNNMKLIEFVEYIEISYTMEILYQNLGIIELDEDASIYMEGSLSLESNIAFFSLTETGGRTRFRKNEIEYTSFLPIDVAVDLLQSDLNLKSNKITNSDRADRLLRYAIYDA